MTTAIVPTHQNSNNSSLAVQEQSNELAMIKQKVTVLLDSGFLPDTIKTWQQGTAIVLYGHELNVPDWMALKHISVIHGAPSIDGQLALALMERSGLLEEFTVVRSDNEQCTLHIKRKNRAAFEHTCTRAEASEMKTQERGNTIPLTEKSNWRQQPKTMLFYFTVKQAGRRAFSDVLNGMAGSKSGDLSMLDIDEEAVVSELPGMPVQIGQTPNENPTSAFQEQPQEPVSEGEWTEPEPPPTDTFDDEFPPIGVVPQEPPPTIGTLNMESLWMRSRINPKSAFHEMLRNMRKAGKIKDNMTADQVVDAIKAWQAAQDFTSGTAGSVEP